MKNNVITEKSDTLKHLLQILISSAIGIAAIFVLFIAFALLMAGRSIPLSIISTLTVVAASAGGVAAGIVCGRLAGKKGMLFGAVCGVVISLTLLIAGAITFGTEAQSTAFIKFIAIVVSGIIGGVIGVNRK
ncbi:MAG: TIGR04086 family membrane protein [Oscillospiraceae bacterium]|nr:TIGR04086 family membrane protein [Oscillospiraceae bacterium]